MGIESGLGLLLVRARQRGAEFGHVLTMGGQSLRIALGGWPALANRLGIGSVGPATFFSQLRRLFILSV